MAAGELMRAGAAMLALAVILPALPGHPGVACPLRTLTGVPCPMCGMTTSVEATVHLRLGDALGANPAGVIAVVVAIVLVVVRPATLPVWAPAVLAGLGAMWLFELHRFAFI
ncbi:MAG: DUF2752 domain-containing protein [Acidimicrobiales bacterium]